MENYTVSLYLELLSLYDVWYTHFLMCDWIWIVCNILGLFCFIAGFIGLLFFLRLAFAEFFKNIKKDDH